ncbi:MAG: large conductance mechanosensitive channel protein MscL [Commensalibacter sp.]|nr:large conductance mechanosensitive channel protein MscL [Commensalibacter sp.]
MEELKNVLPKTPKWIGEFRHFIARGNAIDLAVGVIIGAAFTSVVNSLVKDIFNPVIGLLIGGVDFSNFFVTLKGPHAQTLAEAQRLGAVTINVGVFLNAIIQFLIVGIVIFWTIKLVNKASLGLFKTGESEKSDKPDAPTKDQELLGDIKNLLATRLPPQN